MIRQKRSTSSLPLSKEEMTEVICEVLRRNKLTDAYIRPIISRGVGDLGLDPRKCPIASVIVIAIEWGAMYGDLYEKGLRAITVSVRRNPADALPPNVKSLNYLNNILAKIEANYKGGDEAIFFDTNGYISEGSGDNLYVVKNGEIITPADPQQPPRDHPDGPPRDCEIHWVSPLKEQNLGTSTSIPPTRSSVTGTAAEVAPITWDGRADDRDRASRAGHPPADGRVQDRDRDGRLSHQ